MKRILITGGTGFVGRHLLPLFADEEVHVFDTICGNFFNAVWHEIDLADIEKMRLLIAEIKPTHCIHTAWHVPPNEFWTSAENVAWIYRSFEILKSFAENGGKRAVFIGSCAEYDWTTEELLDETKTPLNPSTFYGICKKSLFEISSEFTKRNNLSFAWARLFFMFGEGEPKEKFVRYVIESLLAEEKAVCKNPDLIRDYMYVGEVARALRAVLESDFEGAINVASGKKTKIGDLAKAIGRIMGKPQLIDFNKSPDSNEPKFLAAKTENLEKIYRMQKSQIECLEFLAERLKIKI
jgi:nucleoside-diphosphate-sugar epimerase